MSNEREADMQRSSSRNHVRDVREKNEAGAIMAEYGLLLVGIVVVAAVSVLALGGPVAELFTVPF